jgi:tetratricopeptide (TPR) repeat protein
MHRNLLIGLLYVCFGVHSLSATAFDDANRQFKSGDFAGAAAAYEKILSTEGLRATVFYNLGNSYLSLKQYGPAILAYERAQLLTPRDPDLSANLALARKSAAAFDESGMNPYLDAVIHYLSRNEWSWLAAASSMFIGGIIFVCGVMKSSPRMRIFAWVASGVAVLGIVAGASALYLRRDEPRRGIILAEDAKVLLSPFEKADSLGTPGQGRRVMMGAKSGNFRYIEVPGSTLRGWLASKDVGQITPEDGGRP